MPWLVFIKEKNTNARAFMAELWARGITKEKFLESQYGSNEILGRLAFRFRSANEEERKIIVSAV